ncbi:retropepsin-like aspartic protease [Bacillus salacetis]|nr:retropepsin-like aspartic protease [Bacillus salacetis]
MEELKTFEFSEHEPGYNGFAAALVSITKGEDLTAAEQLKQLYTAGGDSTLKQQAAKLLFDLYFANSAWGHMETLGLLDEPGIETSNRLIAKACHKSETAIYSLPESPVHIPMKPSLSGCPTIEITVNGKKKFFWLDTGAGMTVVSNSLAHECGMTLLKEKEMVVGNSTNQDLETGLTFIESIEIEGVLITKHPSLVLADNLLEIEIPHLNETMIIDGIIGWDIIQHMHIEIDYKQNQVMIQKPVQKEAKEQNLFFCGAPFVKAQGPYGRRLYFGLDTGANKTHFGQPLLTKLDGLTVKSRILHGGGLGDIKERETKSIESLSIQFNDSQTLSLQNVRMMLSDFGTFFTPDGVFGSDIAKDGRLIIDYENRRLEVISS